MMIRFSHLVLLGTATLGLIACGKPSLPPSSRAADPAASRELLSHIAERYWDDNAALSPWYSWGGTESRFGEAPADAISPQAMADALDIERRYLADVLEVSRAPLDDESKLTYDIFRRERELAIESFTYPSELMPVNPYDGVPQEFALMASAAEDSALSSAKDFEHWQRLAAGFAGWTNQAITNMRDGARRGYTLPRVLVEKTLPVLATLGEDTQANVFYQSMRSSTGTAADAQRSRLTVALAAEVKDKILPSYRSLHDFLEREYLPRSRDSVGLSALPLGGPWYAYLAKRATGSTLTAAQLHALGLTEVQRLHGRLQALLAETSFAGNAQSYLDNMRRDPRFSYQSAGDLLNAYQSLKSGVAAAVPVSFPLAPQADFEIRSVEGFREATSPALSYRPATMSGRNPAVLYVNTADLAARPATAVTAQFLREAVPGHHYQLALQRERADLPRFRRFGGDPAFIEGWGLYAASLGEELGLYRDSETKFTALLAQLECAAGLVIDTGLHSQQWTRQQALEYLHAELPIDDASAANRVDRDLALPGEALACTVGLLKIQGLRTQAQQTLGARFDVGAFHAEVLKNGAVPLDLLEANIKRWMEAVIAAPPKLD
jgi:uncharacterized protein (DUF885 family)